MRHIDRRSKCSAYDVQLQICMDLGDCAGSITSAKGVGNAIIL